MVDRLQALEEQADSIGHLEAEVKRLRSKYEADDNVEAITDSKAGPSSKPGTSDGTDEKFSQKAGEGRSASSTS